MAIQVQLRRGTATQNNAFTGAIGELSFDTTANQIRIHDGSTAGGFKIGTGNFPTGTNNVALGNTALDSLDGSSPGGNNTAVGHDALTANSTASFNTAIGVSSGSLITTGQKNTIVGSFDGNEGGLDIRTSNNHIVLSDGDGNPRLIIDDSGNVDIGGETTELKLKNTTHEDTDGGRESKITFQGEQSGGEQSTLAEIRARHDGTSDDQKGELILKTNDGSDGASPTERIRIDSLGHVAVNTSSPDVNGFGAGNGILTVASDTGSAKTAMLNLVGDGNDTDATRVASIFYNDASGTGAGATLAGIEAYRASAHATDPGADLLFSTNIGSTGGYAERVRIDSSGNLMVGTTTNSGGTSNTKQITGGHFTTKNGVTSIASTGVATTLHSFASNAGNFIVSALASGTGNIEDNTTAIVHINASGTSKITTILAGSRVALSMSGTNLQVTQSVFGSANITWSVMRIR